ncbi:TPA: radical SAM protein [Streptococcus agalactiae]|nr:radical SAM protein [Peptoniphilus harei]
MYTLSLELLKSCNLNCKYCYIEEKTKTILNITDAEKMINFSINKAIKYPDRKLHIYFIGGEPLIEYELMKHLVDYAEKIALHKGVKVSFSTTTNATLLNNKIIEYFINKNISFKISVDGDKQINDLNRTYKNGLGSYENIISKIDLLSRYEELSLKKITCTNVVTINNVHKFFDSLQHLSSIGFKIIETGFNIYDKWEDSDLKILKNQLKNISYYYLNNRQDKDNTKFIFMEKLLSNYYYGCKFFSCKAGINSIYMSADGSIYPCKEAPNLKLGNCKHEKDFMKITEIVKFNETKNKKCLSCKYLNKCSARGCISNNIIMNGDIDEPEKLYCYITKTLFEMFDKYLQIN